MVSRKVLIIGHGYIGRALGRHLLARECSVVAASREPGTGGLYPEAAVNVTDPASVRRLHRDISSPDVIVHCASSGGGGAETYRALFLDGLSNLGEIFPQIPVIFTSSSSVYGQTDGSVVDESSETSPDRETSRVLCEAEAIARGGGGIALRLAGIYGPGRSIHLKKLFENTATIEAGEVSRFLNQIHRDDAARAIAHLILQGVTDHRGGLLNVVDDTPLTQRQCYEALCSRFQLPMPPESPPEKNRKRAWTNKIVSNEALRATGWAPLYPSFLDAVLNDPDLVPSIRGLVD
ncbi:MAG: NAD-dependent epimerase/dehydratase family protein [Verrucomicrobiales bacterium]|jgi:nucleoside-diphosphate-sugar epimerase|nr:NAD-dependent epimerase/dehydratase family protein [Verrucomicrobiales bacterium]